MNLTQKLLKQRNWNQAQLAKKLKCNRSMISHYVTGRYPLVGLRKLKVQAMLKEGKNE